MRSDIRIRFACLCMLYFAIACAKDKSMPVNAEIESRSDALTIQRKIISTMSDSDNCGFIACDAGTGEILIRHNENSPFIPASLSKIITVSKASQYPGIRHRFVTKLLYKGTIDKGILSGDLYLTGGGDPLLTSDDLKKLAQKAIDSGLLKISGNCYFDDSLHRKYLQNAPLNGLSSLCMSYDYSLIFKSENPQKTQLLAPEYPPFFMSKDRSGFLDAAPGYIGSKQSAAYFFDCLRTSVQCPEFVRRAGPPAGCKVLAIHESKTMEDIFKTVLPFSVNHSSELLFAQASAISDYSLEVEETLMFSGSGLSSAMRISPKKMLAVLQDCYESPIYPDGFSVLLDPHDCGYSAQDRLPQIIAKRITAKTGSLAYVLALCGRTCSDSGKELLFVIMATDFQLRKQYESGEAKASDAKRWQQQHLDDQAVFLTHVQQL